MLPFETVVGLFSVWTDQVTAAANHRAHIALFNDAFPEFESSQQPVSLAGESYANPNPHTPTP